MEQLNDCLQLGCLCRSAVQADVHKRMSPPNRQDVPQISKELGIHQSTLYKWRSNWRLEGEVVPASEKTQIAGVLQINSRWCSKQLGLMPLS